MNFSNKNHKSKNKHRNTVSKMRFTLIMLFLSGILISQTGINYKALIKDTNGNVIANQGIDIIFSIQHESVTQYSELQQIVVDVNGIAIATIGEGSPITGTFDTIDWKLRDLELNVQIDFGDGLVDFGNTQFNTVPYAISTLKPQGLEALDQGNGTGYRIVSAADADNYGTIGGQAVDLSFQGFIGNRGATGLFSFASGAATLASATYSVALGEGTSSTGETSFSSGRLSIASANNSTAMGQSTEASGNSSFAIGNFSKASGFSSTAMGSSTLAEAYISTVIGRYNVGGGNATQWSNFDPLFEIGNGSSSSDRNNALTVLKNGTHRISSSGVGIDINAVARGITIGETLYSGIEIGYSGEDAILIYRPNYDGIFILEPGDDGINIESPGNNGIVIANAIDNGIIINTAGNIGAIIQGTEAGIKATSSEPQNPDIVLGGNNSANSNDDGIIASDPNYAGSDIYLRCNDAVVIELDNDDNNSSSFFVRNGDNDNVFSVNESGTIRQNGSTIHSSDRRLKKDIETLEYGLKEVLQLQPKAYNWKNKNQTQKSLGLIAQDVQPIIKEIVKAQDNANKILGISYTELIPVLINAIKEQQKIIDNQGKDLKTSKNNYEALLSRIEILESKSSN